MRTATSLAVVLLVSTSTSAATKQLTMICENLRREYQVTYDVTAGTLHADDTQYRILLKEETVDRLVIVGLTVNDGPTFRAHFRPYKKVEFFADNQLSQTDGCR